MKFVGDIRGGDSFSDIYGFRRFLTATLPVASIIWIKGSIVLFPQTYGPYNSIFARLIARWIIRKASLVVARDLESQAIAQQLSRPGQEILITPDVAFALHADHMDKIDLDGLEQSIPANSLGLNVNGLMYNGGYTRSNMFGLKLDYPSFLTALVSALLVRHSGPIILIPHTYAAAGDVESDNEACKLLRQSLSDSERRRVHVVSKQYDCHQLKGIIGRCVFFAGSRMHSCIAALSQGVPCAGIAYSMKFRGVFASVDAGDCVVDGRTTDNGSALSTVLSLYERRVELHKRTAPAAHQARERLAAVFGSLVRENEGRGHLSP